MRSPRPPAPPPLPHLGQQHPQQRVVGEQRAAVWLALVEHQRQDDVLGEHDDVSGGILGGLRVGGGVGEGTSVVIRAALYLLCPSASSAPCLVTLRFSSPPHLRLL